MKKKLLYQKKITIVQIVIEKAILLKIVMNQLFLMGLLQFILKILILN